MEEDIKRIGDMYLAAALLAYGAYLKYVDHSDPKHKRFCFSREQIEQIYTLEGIIVLRKENPTLEDVETAYVARKLVFPPIYPDSIRRIKSAIHSS